MSEEATTKLEEELEKVKDRIAQRKKILKANTRSKPEGGLDKVPVDPTLKGMTRSAMYLRQKVEKYSKLLEKG